MVYGHGGVLFRRILKCHIDHSGGLDLPAPEVLECDVDDSHSHAGLSHILCLFCVRLCVFFLQLLDRYSRSLGEDACICVDLHNIFSNFLLCAELGSVNKADVDSLVAFRDRYLLFQLSGCGLRIKGCCFFLTICTDNGKCSDLRAFVSNCLDSDGLADLVLNGEVIVISCLNCVAVLVCYNRITLAGLHDGIDIIAVCDCYRAACGSDIDGNNTILGLFSLFFFHNNFESRVFCKRIFPGGGIRIKFLAGINCYTVLRDLKAFCRFSCHFDLLAFFKLKCEVCAIFLYGKCFYSSITEILFHPAIRISCDDGRRLVHVRTFVSGKDHFDGACTIEVNTEAIFLFGLIFFLFFFDRRFDVSTYFCSAGIICAGFSCVFRVCSLALSGRFFIIGCFSCIIAGRGIGSSLIRFLFLRLYLNVGLFSRLFSDGFLDLFLRCCGLGGHGLSRCVVVLLCSKDAGH